MPSSEDATQNLYAHKQESLGYILLLIVCVYLHLNHVVGSKSHSIQALLMHYYS